MKETILEKITRGMAKYLIENEALPCKTTTKEISEKVLNVIYSEPELQEFGPTQWIVAVDYILTVAAKKHRKEYGFSNLHWAIKHNMTIKFQVTAIVISMISLMLSCLLLMLES